MAAERDNGDKDEYNSDDSKQTFYQAWTESLKKVLPGSSEKEARPPVLKEFNLEGIAEFMKKEKPKHVIVMTGAGISTSAGIPDFRSPGSGLYDNLAQFNLPDPQAIFELGFFLQNPKPFFTLAKGLFPKNLKPTPCHYFIRLLDEKGYLLRTYTQNIDSLEHIAGIQKDKVIEAHGSCNTSTCLRCKNVYPMEWMQEKLNTMKDDVPRCPSCEGLVKPDIVFFGENLPRKFFAHALSDFPKCDLLIIMGTSLVVQPFAGMIGEVGDSVPRILINLTKAGQVTGLERFFTGSSGLQYDSDDNLRDAFWQGTCDDGCQKLADMLGFGDELRELVKHEWARIDAEAKANSKKNEGESASAKM